MLIKVMEPQTKEQRTIMKLLLAYCSVEKKEFYDVFCQARKRSNLLALYDQGQLLGCLLLDAHKKHLVACCLLKDSVFTGEDMKDAIEKVLKSRYPEHTICLSMKSYPIS